MNHYVRLMHQELISMCADFAAKKHQDQLRKDNETPYVVHPARVAGLINYYFKFYEKLLFIGRYDHFALSTHDFGVCVCSAWLHDIFEDTDTTELEIYYLIQQYNKISDARGCSVQGRAIIDTVKLLTDDKTLKREERKARSIEKLLGKFAWKARFIKICDRMDNINTITTLGDFATRYLEETREFLDTVGRKVFLDDGCFEIVRDIEWLYDLALEKVGE